MTPEERLTRIEQFLDKQIEFVGASLTRLEKAQETTEERLNRHIEFVGAGLTRLELQVAETSRQIARTSAAGEVTEDRLQRLIGKVDDVEGRVDKLEPKG